MTTESKFPGIPFDASNPQDLARLKAGWPLVQRDGKKFEGKFLAVNESGQRYSKLVFTDASNIYPFSLTGQCLRDASYCDLFFAPQKVRKSKWVAVVRGNGKDFVVQEDSKNSMDSFLEIQKYTILSGPVELPWEEDAPLPPVEQPKAGWYVGPFKSENQAYQISVEKNSTIIYGTLTEVQP